MAVPFHDPASGPGDADLLGDGPRGVRVVAGDEDGADAGPAEGGNYVGGVRPGRVDEADQADELDPLGARRCGVRNGEYSVAI